jgi:methylated-DNA-[protein]-cysteine S-methyltransferase
MALHWKEKPRYGILLSLILREIGYRSISAEDSRIFSCPLLLEAVYFVKPYGNCSVGFPMERSLRMVVAAELNNLKSQNRTSARAVGGAVGHNPISILIPCHRVVGSNGNLTGYAGGIDKKIQLLRLEQVAVANLHFR